MIAKSRNVGPPTRFRTWGAGGITSDIWPSAAANGLEKHKGFLLTIYVEVNVVARGSVKCRRTRQSMHTDIALRVIFFNKIRRGQGIIAG